MFIKHYIIFLEDMYDPYPFAYHKILTDKQDFIEINKFEKILKSKKIDFYTHLVTTQDASIESLKQKDYFFKNVQYTKSKDEFIQKARHLVFVR